MELKFESAQEFQIKKIESIANLFKGQSKAESDLLYAHHLGFISFPNTLTITDKELLKNLNEVQNAIGIKESPNLEYIEQRIQTSDGPVNAKFPNFSVEMETGTGKTYVYIRTAFELSK